MIYQTINRRYTHKHTRKRRIAKARERYDLHVGTRGNLRKREISDYSSAIHFLFFSFFFFFPYAHTFGRHEREEPPARVFLLSSSAFFGSMRINKTPFSFSNTLYFFFFIYSFFYIYIRAVVHFVPQDFIVTLFVCRAKRKRDVCGCPICDFASARTNTNSKLII